jgi:hypothetical protein
MYRSFFWRQESCLVFNDNTGQKCRLQECFSEACAAQRKPRFNLDQLRVLKAMQPLVPPNPKEFEITALIRRSTALCGV